MKKEYKKGDLITEKQRQYGYGLVVDEDSGDNSVS